MVREKEHAVRVLMMDVQMRLRYVLNTAIASVPHINQVDQNVDLDLEELAREGEEMEGVVSVEQDKEHVVLDLMKVVHLTHLSALSLDTVSVLPTLQVSIHYTFIVGIGTLHCHFKFQYIPLLLLLFAHYTIIVGICTLYCQCMPPKNFF